MQNEYQQNGAQSGQTQDQPKDPSNLSIKERRELKRQEKLRNRSQQELLSQKKTWYRVVLWFFVVIVLGVAIFALIKLAGQNGLQNNGTGPNGGIETNILSTVTPADWTRDNLNASTTLIEYGDFQCPACGAFYPITKQVDQQFGANLRFIFREFPLNTLHPNAMIAAQAAEAAGKQGQNKFWAMHDLLYENQTTWAPMSTADATNAFMGYAKQISLNITQFTNDFNSATIAQKIQQSETDGINKYGINGTPTFFLNNEELPPPSSAAQFYQEIQTVIQQANGNASTTTATSTSSASK
jgi:protein-disulfide isomerase